MADIRIFYYPDTTKKGNRIQLANADFHHMRDVLKIKEGSRIHLLTLDGKYWAFLSEYHESFALLLVGEKIDEIISLPNIHLIQGIPKGWKMDEIIEKATEMGVVSIIPVYTSRSVPRYSKEEEFHKAKRWEKIAISASKQSRREKIPKIHPICDLQGVFDEISQSNFGKLLFWELEQKQNLFLFLKQNLVMDYYAFIGPEGGISYEEAELALKANFQSFSLGTTILRTETASPFAIGLLRYLWTTLNEKSFF